MPEFDPRRTPSRNGLMLGVGGVAMAFLGWELTAGFFPAPEPPPSAADMRRLQSEAFAQAEVLTGYGRPESVLVKIGTGESFQSAIQSVGLAKEEARQVVDALSQGMDTVHIKAGLAFDAAIARPQMGAGPVRLIGLSLRSGPATALTLSRTFDGALRLRELTETVRDETKVAEGRIDGSLYESAAKLGASPAITGAMVRLFAHKIDFDRDLRPGDRFQLIFDRQVTESGRTVETGDLQYAEIKGVRFYRFAHGDDADYFDESGKNIKGFLLRTPVDGAAMTSGFGMRRHPILGFNRMHQGIDFGAGTGTPVLAAGDGVVVQEERWGGYGNWLRIRHNDGWETGYAHLARYAAGLKRGQHVRQGQVVAYVGTTGLSTGPHLHYEIWLNGQRVNPVSARVPQGTELAGAELKAFRAQQARIDQMLGAGGLTAEAPTVLQVASSSDDMRTAGLRR